MFCNEQILSSKDFIKVVLFNFNYMSFVCAQKVDTGVIQRFYLTLMLHELWKQYTVWDVADRFQLPRGFIQNLLSSAASFASCVLRFAQVWQEHRSV
jgi:hypothetical protein